jgi:hypothetical protein
MGTSPSEVLAQNPASGLRCSVCTQWSGRSQLAVSDGFFSRCSSWILSILLYCTHRLRENHNLCDCVIPPALVTSKLLHARVLDDHHHPHQSTWLLRGTVCGKLALFIYL